MNDTAEKTIVLTPTAGSAYGLGWRRLKKSFLDLFLIIVIVAAVYFGRNPRIIDSWIQCFQARIFLSGALVAHPPPSFPHFAAENMLMASDVWVSQYPPVAPPSIVVSAAYPGASAQTLEDSVLSVIEREMNGAPGLIYMESVAQADGSGNITLSFQAGTNADLAQVEVQNRLARATPRLPAAVTQQGVRVDKARSNFLLFTILSSSNPDIDPIALGDFAARNVLPELQRVPGVGQAQLFGTERAMRVWIDPARLLGYQLSTSDVVAAIRAQNAQLAIGQLGGDAKPLSASEELLRVRAGVILARLDAPDAPLPPALIDEAHQAVARVDAATPAGYPRQAAINAAANLYWEAGLDAEASTLLTAELDKSTAPYYFMLDLADLAEKAGRKQEAVDWLARAYAGAKGPATRFQWGYNYLVGMLELTPEDVQGIERAGLAVLGELDGSPDAFYQRTRMRLEQLDAKLLEWGQTGAAAKVIDTLRARTSEICRKLPEQDSGRANCEKFLAAKARPTQAA